MEPKDVYSMDELNYLKVLHELWKTQCIGVFEIKKFLFFKGIDLQSITKEKITARTFDKKTQFRVPSHE